MNKAWPLVSLGEVLTERQEIPSVEALAKGDIRIVAKIGFNDGKIQLRNGSETKTGMILVRPGDLLISGINAAKGAIAIYEEENTNPIAATIHYGAYIPKKDRVDVKYLWWLLRSKIFRNLLDRYVPGGIKTELKAKRLLPIPVTLPSLEDQRWIVAKIDELAAKIHQAQTLRQQSTKETDAIFTTEVSTRFQGDKYWGSVGDAVSIRKGAVRSGPFGSQLHHEEFVTSGVAAIGTRDVQTNRFELTGSWYITPEKFQTFKRYEVFPKDILCTIVGASIGRFCVVPKDAPLAFTTKHIQALTLNSEKADPHFVSFMLNFHSRCRMSLFSQVEGSAQPSLNAAKVLSIELPLPPLEEQRRVVAELYTLQAEADALRGFQSEIAAELDALLPSILDKAFKGEL